MTVTYAANDSVVVSKAGTAITMNGAPCGAATTATADLIATAGTVTGNESFVVDLGPGPFAPGATVEASGLSEIEFRVDLGAATDMLAFTGSAAGETITFGSTGSTLNDDGDHDVTATAVEVFLVSALGGDDVVSGGGGGGTGAAFATTLIVHGGDGNDTLVGGSGADDLNGDAGNDLIKSREGNDLVTGGDGNDVIESDAGNDVVEAGAGNDTLNGEDGTDKTTGIT